MIFSENGVGTLTLNSQGSISLGNSNQANANFYGYGSSMNISQNSVINGNLYSAGSLYLGNDVVVNGNIPVPEPACLVFLASGLLVLAGKQKLKSFRSARIGRREVWD